VGDRRRILGGMKLLPAVVLLASVALAASACRSSRRTTDPPDRGSTVSSTRMLLGGTVRCTASAETAVSAGHDLGVTFTLHNVSKLPADLHLSYGGVWVVVKSPDGTTYDTRVPLENASGPGAGPISIRPGATVRQRLLPDLRVRWTGPLRITPGCSLVASGPLRVTVKSPGPPTDATTAINAVVAASGHLLDHCRPRASGVSVVGRIDSPDSSAPALRARCSIDLRREGDFDVAQVLILTPPGLHGIRVEQPYEALTGASAANRNREALAWQFVVTRDGATSVSSAHFETTRPGGRMAHGWFWSSSGPKTTDDFRCGGSGGGSGNANGPEVVFASVCGTGR
jgi:hypothetical protein